jgi:hypothetical protein
MTKLSDFLLLKKHYSMELQITFPYITLNSYHVKHFGVRESKEMYFIYPFCVEPLLRNGNSLWFSCEVSVTMNRYRPKQNLCNICYSNYPYHFSLKSDVGDEKCGLMYPANDLYIVQRRDKDPEPYQLQNYVLFRVFLLKFYYRNIKCAILLTDLKECVLKIVVASQCVWQTLIMKMTSSFIALFKQWLFWFWAIFFFMFVWDLVSFVSA